MTTIKRYTKSGNTNNGGGNSSTPPKGSKDNPYTMAEYLAIPDEEWKGGYVEEMGYVLPNVDVWGSSTSNAYSDNFSDWFSNWPYYGPSSPWSNMFSNPKPDDRPDDNGNGNGDSGNNGDGGDDNNTHGEGESESNQSGTHCNPYPPAPDDNNLAETGERYTFDANGCYSWEKVGDTGTYQICASGETLPLEAPLKIIEDAEYGIQFKATYQTFVFLATHTNVEWAASFNEDGTAYINTINEHDHVNVPILPGYTNVIHSHPEGTFDIDKDWNDIKAYTGFLRYASKNEEYRYEKILFFLCGQEPGKEIINVTKDVKSITPD